MNRGIGTVIYDFTIKQDNSVSYKIESNFNSSGSLGSGSNGSSSYFFNITIISIKSDNMSVQINSTKEDNYSQLYYAPNQSSMINMLLIQGYPSFFISHLDLTDNSISSMINITSNVIIQSYNDSWYCRSCPEISKDDQIISYYDLNSGWLINSTEIYTESRSSSEHFTAGFSIRQTTMKAVAWNITDLNTNIANFTGFSVIFISFTALIIINKFQKRNRRL